MEFQQIQQPELNYRDYKPEQREFIPSQQQNADSMLQLIFNNSNLIPLLEHELKGEIEIEFTDEQGIPHNKWEKKGEPMLVSESAIQEMLRFCRMMGLNNVSLLSTLDFNQITEKMRQFEFRFQDFLCNHSDEWDLDERKINMVYWLIVSLIDDAVSRARNGKLLDTLRSTFSSTEYRDTTPQALKPMSSFLSRGPV